VNLGGEWKSVGDAENHFLSQLEAQGQKSGQLQLRGHIYEFDLVELMQKNVSSGKKRQIRRSGGVFTKETGTGSAGVEVIDARPEDSGTRPGDSATQPPLKSEASLAKERCLEVWLEGEWKELPESEEISCRQGAGEKVFNITSRGYKYKIDLTQMTQTNLSSGRTRTIRFTIRAATGPALGFEEFRGSFRKHAPHGKLNEQDLMNGWPQTEGKHGQLAQATVQAILREMDLRRNGAVDMVEWNHYWALERDSPSFHAGNEVNAKLVGALQNDSQVLGRMQMHYETAIGEDKSSSGWLSGEGLLRVCQRLVDSPKQVVEKQWAREVLQKHKRGESFDEDAEFSYYDFLNVMLGRKRFKVSLWLYDISDGVAARWSWLLLGQHFEGIWHSGVVVEWPERSSEFWFGGELFESPPGRTPFGAPVERRPLGHTYKLREEVWDHMRRSLASEFTRERYDVLTHNCNHFSDKLCLFLMNEHIPDEVLHQPDMVMSRPLPWLLRPLLNRWLGGFDSQEGRATDGGDSLRHLWEQVLPGAVVEFSKEEGGRSLVGEVTQTSSRDCLLSYFDFWSSKLLQLLVPSNLVTRVLHAAPPGAMAKRLPSIKSDVTCGPWLRGLC